MNKIDGVHNVFMLRPKNFGYNYGTKSTNPFQNEVNFDSNYIAKKATLEFDDMVQTLDDHKITIHTFEDDVVLEHPDAVFLNNWLAVMPQKELYLFPMEAESRRRERRHDIVEVIKHKFEIVKTVDLSHHEQAGAFLESTGSVVFDYKDRIAYAAISTRTNEQLFNDFCHEIGYEGFVFTGRDFSGTPIYHTNILLSIANKYAILCADAIENLLEKALVLKRIEKTGKEIIKISMNQMLSFAGNCLEVYDRNGNSKLVMSRTGFSSLKAEQISTIEKYSEIVIVNVSIIERIGGGSARCMMLGIPC
jgi:hypothetical protein